MIGLEPTWEEHVENLLNVFRECRRVLRDDGTFWLNYGDRYQGGSTRADAKADSLQAAHRGGIIRPGKKTKNLMMLPSRIAMALQDDGWILRSEIVWCLSGGTWLYAKTQKGVGVHMLRDLARLDPETVHLWNGEKWTKVRGWSKTGRPENPIELVLRSGEKIGCTADHRWPTQRGLLRAADLSVGDVIQTTRTPESGKTPEWLTDDALWFAGLYLADGSMSGNTIQISGHSKEIERWERVNQLCDHYGASANFYEHGNIQNIHIRSVDLRAVLAATIVGRAKDKHLASEVWGWGNEALRNIVTGYFDGDSKDGNRWRLGFTRNYFLQRENYSLQRDLRAAAARLGATLTLNSGFFEGEKFPSFRGEWRWEQSGHPNEKDRAEIVKIQRSRARHFYDVGVEDEPHLFALSSGILTHNSKSNPMPESVTDRPTCAHEKVFLFSKQKKYFYDVDAVRNPLKRSSSPHGRGLTSWATSDGYHSNTTNREKRESGKRYDSQYAKLYLPGEGKDFTNTGAQDARSVKQRIVEGVRNGTIAGSNLRNVWKIPTQGFKGAHFATFPEKLVRLCLLAGTSERGCCSETGDGFSRETEKKLIPMANRKDSRKKGDMRGEPDVMGRNEVITTGWTPTCGAPLKRIIERQSSSTVKTEFIPIVDEGEQKLSGWESVESFYDNNNATVSGQQKWPGIGPQHGKERDRGEKYEPMDTRPKVTVGFKPSCEHHGDPVPCVVLDPFAGSGTVGVVAEHYFRNSILIEISQEYAEMIKKRLLRKSLFATVTLDDGGNSGLEGSS